MTALNAAAQQTLELHGEMDFDAPLTTPVKTSLTVGTRRLCSIRATTRFH